MRSAACVLGLAVMVSAQLGVIPTPVPIITPTGVCDSYCCALTDRDACCGENVDDDAAEPCPVGPDSGYCSYTGLNRCDRNCYDRGGECAEVELSFNTAFPNAGNQTALNELADQMAQEAYLLIGGPKNAAKAVSATYEANISLLTVVIRCPDGGCGSLQYIASAMCPAGSEVTNTGGQVVWKGSPACLTTAPGGGLSVDFPKEDLAGYTPIRVTARSCGTCVPTLGDDVSFFVNTSGTIQRLNAELDYISETVNGPSISPAFTDSPVFNELCNVPQQLQGLQHFRMNSTAVLGTQFTIRCPNDCQSCDAFITHYHDPPCSSEHNGNYPALLPAAGWTPSGCAPCLTGGPDGQRYPMVIYHKRIAGGRSETTPPVSTSCLKYFAIFAGSGADCESNALQDATLCAKAGGLCVYENGQCKTRVCPSRPPAAGSGRLCTPLPGLGECPLNPDEDELDALLGQL